jgi:hypothetical protein
MTKEPNETARCAHVTDNPDEINKTVLNNGNSPAGIT